MRSALSILVVVGLIVFVVALLASGSLGLALAFGWVLKQLFSFDLFHSTALGLIAVVAGEIIVVKALLQPSDSSGSDWVDTDDVIDADDVDAPPAARSRSVLRNVIAIVDRDGLGDSGGRGRGGRRRRRH